MILISINSKIQGFSMLDAKRNSLITFKREEGLNFTETSRPGPAAYTLMSNDDCNTFCLHSTCQNTLTVQSASHDELNSWGRKLMESLAAGPASDVSSSEVGGLSREFQKVFIIMQDHQFG